MGNALPCRPQRPTTRATTGPHTGPRGPTLGARSTTCRSTTTPLRHRASASLSVAMQAVAPPRCLRPRPCPHPVSMRAIAPRARLQPWPRSSPIPHATRPLRPRQATTGVATFARLRRAACPRRFVCPPHSPSHSPRSQHNSQRMTRRRAAQTCGGPARRPACRTQNSGQWGVHLQRHTRLRQNGKWVASLPIAKHQIGATRANNVPPSPGSA